MFRLKLLHEQIPDHITATACKDFMSSQRDSNYCICLFSCTLVNSLTIQRLMTTPIKCGALFHH